MDKYIVNNFLPEHHQKAEDELICYEDCKEKSEQYFKLNRLDKAAAYSENATRSLNVLAELKADHDKAWFQNKQFESERSQEKLIQQQVASVYE